MCGLIGMAGNISVKEEKMFKALLLLDVIRGKHSTGFASMQVPYNQPALYSVVKDKYNAVDFMDTKPFNDLMAKKHYILMGHNRHATQGAIVPENAHPFEFEHLIGAHNGSLYSGWKTSLHDGANQVVDSAALYSELNQNGVEELWGKLNGPAALTWIDKRNGSINFLRNRDRPLWWTTANKETTLVWASEPWMLHVAAGREGVVLDENPREVAVDSHYCFDVPTKWGVKVTHNRTAVKAYVAPKWAGSKRYDDYYNDYDSTKFLDKEGVKVGDTIEFTVEKISDHFDNGKQKCSIRGKTLLGNPFSAYQVDSLKFEELLLEMWEYDNMVFSAKVKYATAYGLIMDIETATCVHYTLQDLAEAEERQKAEKEARELKEEIKLLAASLGPKDTLQ